MRFRKPPWLYCLHHKVRATFRKDFKPVQKGVPHSRALIIYVATALGLETKVLSRRKQVISLKSMNNYDSHSKQL